MPDETLTQRLAHDVLDIDPVILSRIRHLDLTNFLILEGSHVVSSGAYGDIFKCRCTIEGLGEIDVAGKRLRFHVNTLDFKRVRLDYTCM